VITLKHGVCARQIGVSYTTLYLYGQPFLHFYVIVKMTAEIKKNLDMANVSPNTYDRNLKDKKNEPHWTIGAKLMDIDKRVGPSP
jgi:hypothetical protein